MFVVAVDFSKNNLATEQLNVQSFYDLPIFNESLFSHQVRNLTDLAVDKIYMLDERSHAEPAKQIFETEFADSKQFEKELFQLSNKENILILKNNVYFECDFSRIYDEFSEQCNKELTLICGKDNAPFAIIASVKDLKKELHHCENIKVLFETQVKKCQKNIIAEGYIKSLETVKDYKYLLFDILNCKTVFKPTFVAEGIFTDGIIPEGDYVINPPVFLENGVQIENGSVIGPNVVILKDSLVSKNSVIKNSILFSNVYISSDCFVDGAVCCKGVSVKRDSAVFPKTVIGENSIIGEDVTVEKGSIIRKNVKINNYVKSPFNDKFKDNINDCFQGLTPEKAALLGSSVGVVFKRPKICIASDGEPNSLAVKLALLSGLVCSGADCIDLGNTYNSRVFYCTDFCEFQYSVFVIGRGGGTDVKIYDSSHKLISKSACYNLISAASSKDFMHCESGECKNIRQIKGLKKTYIRDVSSMFSKPISINAEVVTENKFIEKTFDDILSKAGVSGENKEKITFLFNYSGTALSCYFNGKNISDNTLKRLVSFSEKNKTGESDEEPNFINDLWRFDSVILAFKVLKILEETEKSILDLIEGLPRFYVMKKSVILPVKSGEFAKKFSDFENIRYADNGIDVVFPKGKISVNNSDNNSCIKVHTCSQNFAFAAELADFITDYLKND